MHAARRQHDLPSSKPTGYSLPQCDDYQSVIDSYKTEGELTADTLGNVRETTAEHIDSMIATYAESITESAEKYTTLLGDALEKLKQKAPKKIDAKDSAPAPPHAPIDTTAASFLIDFDDLYTKEREAAAAATTAAHATPHHTPSLSVQQLKDKIVAAKNEIAALSAQIKSELNVAIKSAKLKEFEDLAQSVIGKNFADTDINVAFIDQLNRNCLASSNRNIWLLVAYTDYQMKAWSHEAGALVGDLVKPDGAFDTDKIHTQLELDMRSDSELKCVWTEAESGLNQDPVLAKFTASTLRRRLWKTGAWYDQKILPNSETSPLAHPSATAQIFLLKKIDFDLPDVLQYAKIYAEHHTKHGIATKNGPPFVMCTIYEVFRAYVNKIIDGEYRKLDVRHKALAEDVRHHEDLTLSWQWLNEAIEVAQRRKLSMQECIENEERANREQVHKAGTALQTATEFNYKLLMRTKLRNEIIDKLGLVHLVDFVLAKNEK